jgi:hypothetical protein
MLFKLADNKDTAGYIASAVCNNFDKLPPNVITSNFKNHA